MNMTETQNNINNFIKCLKCIRYETCMHVKTFCDTCEQLSAFITKESLDALVCKYYINFDNPENIKNTQSISNITNALNKEETVSNKEYLSVDEISKKLYQDSEKKISNLGTCSICGKEADLVECDECGKLICRHCCEESEYIDYHTDMYWVTENNDVMSDVYSTTTYTCTKCLEELE